MVALVALHFVAKLMLIVVGQTAAMAGAVEIYGWSPIIM
jgi:hypothetical protein